MRVDREKAIRMDFGGGTFVCGQHCAHASPANPGPFFGAFRTPTSPESRIRVRSSRYVAPMRVSGDGGFDRCEIVAGERLWNAGSRGQAEVALRTWQIGPSRNLVPSTAQIAT